MSDSPPPFSRALTIELSDREIYLIGRCVVLWGAIECQIFEQTARTYSNVDEMPKEMNNLQSSSVLDLWNTRVITAAPGALKTILEAQYLRIKHYSEFRNDIVHGMWDFSLQTPERIIVARVKKRQFIEVHFTGDDFEAMMLALSEINFILDYPNELSDLAAVRAQSGGYKSRRFTASITGNPIASDWRELSD